AVQQQDTLAGMDRVQRMIEEGDLDAAMAELNRMLGETEGLLSKMEEGREELGSRDYSEVREAAKKLWKDLEEVASQERELARRTEQHSRAVLDKMKKRLGDPKAFVEKQKKRLAEVEAALERAKPGAHLIEGDTFDQAKRR